MQTEVMATGYSWQLPLITVGMLLAFQMFAGRMSQPLLRLVGLWQEFQQANIAVKRLGDILDVPQEPHTLTSTRENQGPGRIDLSHLAFRYSEHHPWLYLSDMEAWYEKIKSQIPVGATLNVTGYSLGGHLATAFNLLRREDGTIGNVDNVVTFNGAGVGLVNTGDLKGALGYFNTLRANSAQIKAKLFSVPELANLYDSLKTRLDFTNLSAEQANATNDANERQVA